MGFSTVHRRFFRVTAPIMLFCSIALAQAPQDSLALPPRESGGQFREPDLVELAKLDTTIHLDIRYATANNFMRKPMYTEARAFLQRPAAEALLRVMHALRSKGYGLTIFDGYRPWSVSKKFWDGTPPDKRKYVANPRKGSIHNRGCAVDLTLYDLKSGQEVSMPSPYDDFTHRASPVYRGGTAVERAHRELLRKAMQAEGFKVNSGEWWHFDYKDWSAYGILNIPFEDIGKDSTR